MAGLPPRSLGIHRVRLSGRRPPPPGRIRTQPLRRGAHRPRPRRPPPPIPATAIYRATHDEPALYPLGLFQNPEPAHPTQHTALLHQLQTLQQPEGGWRLSALDKTERHDNSPEPTASDGIATALTVLAMEESGTPVATPPCPVASIGSSATSNPPATGQPPPSTRTAIQPATSASS